MIRWNEIIYVIVCEVNGEKKFLSTDSEKCYTDTIRQALAFDNKWDADEFVTQLNKLSDGEAETHEVYIRVE